MFRSVGNSPPITFTIAQKEFVVKNQPETCYPQPAPCRSYSNCHWLGNRIYLHVYTMICSMKIQSFKGHNYRLHCTTTCHLSSSFSAAVSCEAVAGAYSWGRWGWRHPYLYQHLEGLG